MLKAHEGVYNGYPVINLVIGKRKDGSEKVFSFGVNKARAIVENAESIKTFANKNKDSS